MVVETEDDHYVGTLSIDGDKVRVNTHTAGHPVLLDIEDIERIIPFAEYEAAEIEPHTDSATTLAYIGAVHGVNEQ